MSEAPTLRSRKSLLRRAPSRSRRDSLAARNSLVPRESLVSQVQTQLSEEESEVVQSMLWLALDLDKSIDWTTDKSKSDLRVDYCYVPPPGEENCGEDADSIATIRGMTDIEGFEPSDYFTFSSTDNEEQNAFYKLVDPMCEEMTTTKVLDDNRCIVYSRYNAGPGAKLFIWKRDFCYKQVRVILKNYTVNQLIEPQTFSEIVMTVCIGVDKKDPNYVSKRKDHVRGHVKMGGFVFLKKDDKDTHSQLVYIANINPKGWLPKWVVNLVGPSQAGVCIRVKENIDFIKDFVAKSSKGKEES